MCCTILVVTEGVWAAAVMILGHPFSGYCYSREEQVLKYVGEMLLLISLSQLFDGIPSILSDYVQLSFLPRNVAKWISTLWDDGISNSHVLFAINKPLLQL